MRLEDIPLVVSIDRLSFSSPWSPNTYQFEVNNHETSHLVVIEVYENGIISPNGLRGLFNRLRHSKTTPPLAGYGGCWLIEGEAHISTIAVHPDYRGRGLGELLLVNMLQRAMNLNGDYSVLEVRASNYTAQSLYEKYEYKVVGRRKGYYRDDGEDALLMEVRPFDEAYRQRFAVHSAALSQRITFVDQFTRQARPGK
jgi:ribosomal-protein-alanine N-acetyltransferase